MATTKCEHCQASFSVRDEAVGKRAKCPKCGQPFVITVVGMAPKWAAVSELADAANRKVAPGARTVASEPGEITLSREKLLILYPDFFSFTGRLRRLRLWAGKSAEVSVNMLNKHLLYGDSRAAVVMSIDPLLVAAYTDECDCVAMLRFPTELVGRYALKRGAKLLTVNTYMRGPKRLPADLIAGPNGSGRWHNFCPFIAEFMSDDMPRIEFRKLQIAREEWEKTARYGTEYLQKHPGKARDGRPLMSQWPCITSWF